MKQKGNKWKPGQLITLWGSIYRISKCKYSSGYKACFICNQQNGKPPCICAFDYPDKHGFDLRMCREKLPEGCIPKRIQISPKVSD